MSRASWKSNVHLSQVHVWEMDLQKKNQVSLLLIFVLTPRGSITILKPCVSLVAFKKPKLVCRRLVCHNPKSLPSHRSTIIFWATSRLQKNSMRQTKFQHKDNIDYHTFNNPMFLLYPFLKKNLYQYYLFPQSLAMLIEIFNGLKSNTTFFFYRGTE